MSNRNQKAANKGAKRLIGGRVSQAFGRLALDARASYKKTSDKNTPDKKAADKKLLDKEVLLERLDNARERLFNRKELIKHAETPYEVHYTDGMCSLRRYIAPATVAKKYTTPLVFVTPLAVSTDIYDLLKTRSLIQHFLLEGFDVFLVDWGKPTRKESHYGFDFYATQALKDMIKAVKDASGSSEVSLHGWSMGGLFCLIYAAGVDAMQDKPSVKNLILCGTPVDGHASGFLGKLFNIAGNTFEYIEDHTGLHPKHLPDDMLYIKGWMNMLAFKALDPLGTVKSYWNMFKNLDDKEALAQNAAKADFLINMLDYPGAIIKDIGLRFWFGNKLVKSNFYVGDRPIDLQNISSNLFVIAGTSDSLVTADAARPIMTLTQSHDKEFLQTPGGHVGILSSQISKLRVWPQMSAWLAERS